MVTKIGHDIAYQVINVMITTRSMIVTPIIDGGLDHLLDFGMLSTLLVESKYVNWCYGPVFILKK